MPFPTFTDDQILTADELNAIVTETQNQLSALSNLDVAWPLVAQGDLDMNGYSITNVIRFFKIFDASQYDTLNLAIAAVEAAGGGCLLIPPNTTIVADGVDFDVSNIAIVGCGRSSVLQLTSTSVSGYLLRSSVANLTGVTFANLTFDGGSYGTGQKGLVLRYCDDVTLDRVFFKDFTGDCLQLTNSGVNGQACSKVRATSLYFSGGSASHIIGNDIEDAIFEGIHSDSSGADAISFVPTNVAQKMRWLKFTDIQIRAYTNNGLVVKGSGASPSVNFSYIDLTSVRCTGGTGTGEGVVLGDDSNVLQYVSASNVRVNDSTRDGIRVSVKVEGELNNCGADSSTAIGLDMLASEYVSVFGGKYVSNGTFGVDASGTTNCTVRGADLRGNSTRAINKVGSTSGTFEWNTGDIGGTPRGHIWADYLNASHTGTTSEQVLATFNIPASVLTAGRFMKIWITGFKSGSASTGTMRLKIGAQNVAVMSYTAASTDIVVSALMECTADATQETTGMAWGDSTNGDNIATSTTFDGTTLLTVQLTVQNVNAADTLGIDSYCLEVFDAMYT